MIKTLRAIIVEDDENDFFLVVLELERYGFAVEALRAGTADELRRALTRGPWDIVLSDYRLPHFNGRDALKIVRSGETALPFILITAALGDELAVELMRLGADDYVLKDRLGRLGYSVERAVREYEERRERSYVHEALAAAQRRFQQTFEHAPIGIAHINASGVFLNVNDRFCRMVGYTREELERMTFLELTHEDDRASSHLGYIALRSGAQASYRAEKRYVRKDGVVIWVDLIANVVFDSEGNFDYSLGMVEEITARKEAEEKIRHQELLLDAVEQAVIATDVVGNITYWNRFAHELYGWSEAEVLGKHLLDVIDPVISGALASEILNRLVTGESWTGELEVTRHDGKTLPVMVVESPIFEANGVLAGMVGVSIDLSERKAAEVALRRSEERYRNVIEGVKEIIISVSPDARIASVNQAFLLTTGWAREEIVGRELWVLLPPEQAPIAAQRLADRFHGRGPTAVTGNLLCEDGRSLAIEGVACVGADAEGVPEVFYFLHDITDRVRAEEERTRLAEQLRLVLESTDEGIYAVDAEGTCTLFNGAAAQILGFTPEEMLGRTIHDVIHDRRPDGSAYSKDDCPVFHALRRGTKERVRDEVFWRRDGSPVPIEYAAAPVVENGQIIGAVTTFSDVSRRRMLESQLETANRLNGLGRVAATIAHEFNNILMGIQPFVDILRIEAGPNARMQQVVERITASVRRGKRVTSEILQFTRQSQPTRKSVDVSSWLDELVAEARQVLGPDIDFSAHSEPGIAVAGDAPALQQVFMNMIVNSRDALQGRGGWIGITARRSDRSVFPFGVVEHGEQFAHFAVSDDGCGIPPDAMQHVFEPLFTTKKSGTGLGLALAHHVVQQLGGYIFAESEKGAGATFHIFLPLTEEAAAPKSEQLATRPEGLRSIVLVEDDPSVAAGLVALLALDDIEVHVASTGGEALATIERVGPDAVVLDVGLPDIDGTAVYESIKGVWPSLPVVFATGHVDASRLSAYLSRPNVGHVLKPYELTALYESLAELTAAPQ